MRSTLSQDRSERRTSRPGAVRRRDAAGRDAGRPRPPRRRRGGPGAEALRSLAVIGAVVAGALVIGATLEPAVVAEGELAPIVVPVAAAEAAGPAGEEQALVARPLLPDLQVLTPSGFYLIDQTASGGDKRLKFTTTIWNAGPGALEVRGRQHPRTAELVVYQMLHTPTGDVVPGGPVGTFRFDHRHGHLHLAAFARYELWSASEDGGLLELVAQNEKVGFCLMDNVEVDAGLIDVAKGVYPTDCRGEVQGISPGYGDVYVAQLYEQDLVIDGLPDGRYAVVNVANPDGAVAELDLENNVAVAYVRLSGGRVLPD